MIEGPPFVSKPLTHYTTMEETTTTNHTESLADLEHTPSAQLELIMLTRAIDRRYQSIQAMVLALEQSRARLQRQTAEQFRLEALLKARKGGAK